MPASTGRQTYYILNNSDIYITCLGYISFLQLVFLTNQTTCASVLSKRTTSEKVWQKRPPGGGGTSGQATRGTCRLGQRRHVHAATANAGTSAAVDGR
jgi:hypothetical protein